MPTALIIDDEIANIEVLKVYLSLHGIAVVTSMNSRDSVELAQFHCPDIILMDLLIADALGDGYAMVHAIKSNPLTQHIPIVATATDDEELAMAIGCDAFISRPFRKNLILNILHGLLPEEAA